MGHYGIAESVEVLHLQDFEEAVFDDGYGEASGDVTWVGVLAESFFDFGVHEDCAAGAEVARASGAACHFGEVGELDVHHSGEALEEGAAT